MDRRKSDDGSFYKFTKPAPKHPQYKQGDSWCEELGFSKDEFDTAKREVVTHYPSKDDWKKGYLNEGSFKNKPFSSYYDRQNHLVHYFPNPSVINYILQTCDIEQNSQSGNPTLQHGGKATLYKVEKPPSTKWQSRFRSIQKITQENTQEITSLASSSDDVCFVSNTTKSERTNCQ